MQLAGGDKLDARALARIRQARAVDGRFDGVAIELGFASDEALLRAIGESMHLEFVDLAATTIDLSVLKGFPLKLIHRLGVFPLREEDGSLVVAVGNPFDLQALDAISAATGMDVVPVLTVPDELVKLVKTHLGVGAETIDGLLAQQEDRQPGNVEILEDVEFDKSDAAEMAQEPSVVRLVNEILTEAINGRASDIHIEAQGSGIKIRYRIDGVLQKQPMPPEINRFYAAIISRLKIMARMNIAEKRVPQDGRIKVKVCGREVDIRVSIIPMLHGEGVVMRILDKSAMQFSLRGVGMDEDIYAAFHRLIEMPHGIILVTGPTGSGKTTTLYSALGEIRSESTKIITTEDPIEYELEGINQIQVHAKVGLTFAAGLRAILRHDPDVVLVGEIRDYETAENAIQAALTGHLVFSTLHTNDAASAFTRMVDIGVEPFLVTSTVEGVMAQRLVRNLCMECRQPIEADSITAPADFPMEQLLSQGGTLYRQEGCRACRGTGYRGRSGIFELLENNDDIRQMIGDRVPAHIVKQAARKAGMRTLRQDGWLKVLRGETTIDEVLRVAKTD